MLYASQLKDRNIRLIQLELDTYRAPVRCQLIEASLDDLPAYEALSYAWGSAEVTEPIHCNGEILHVTKNLARALRRIRLGLSPPIIDTGQGVQDGQEIVSVQKHRDLTRMWGTKAWKPSTGGTGLRFTLARLADRYVRRKDHRRSTKTSITSQGYDRTALQQQLPTLQSDSVSRKRPYRPFFLWVDAICINQADVVERNSQVKLMGDLYSNATRVIIWLGDTKANMRLILLVQHIIHFIFSASPTATLNEYYTTLFQNLLETIPGGQQDFKLALSAAFSSDWFLRIWCTQEGFLARQTTVLYRNAEIAGKHMSVFCVWPTMAYHPDLTPLVQSVPDLSTKLIQGIARLSPELLGTADERSTVTLSFVRTLRASNPRDKFYGLLGLLGANKIDIDYNKSIAEVYIDSVLQTASNGLHVLSLVFQPSEYTRSDLPSWVPNWDVSPDEVLPKPLSLGNLRKDTSTVSRRQVPAINAHLARSGILELPGLLCDTVISRSEILGPVGSLTTEVSAPLRVVFQDLWDEVVVQNISTSTTLLSWAKTFTGGRSDILPGLGLDEYCVDTMMVANFLYFTRKLLSNDAHAMLGKWIADQYLSNSAFTLVGNWISTGDAATYEQLIDKSLDQRRSFRTKKSWLGLGPQCMRVGDIVAVFHGGLSPYVLRPIEGRPDHYHLMGECYIDNLTNEGAYARVGGGGVEERVFHLI